jgi:hypothetical protein
MRNRILLSVIVVFMLLIANFVSAGQPIKMTGPNDAQNKSGNRPHAVFPEKEHVFKAIFEGAKIKHDFVVENKGSAALVIKNVRPD